MPSRRRDARAVVGTPAEVSDPLGVRGYLARDWEAMRDAKRRYWQARLEHGGLAEALRVTEQLRAWTVRNNPSWPTEQQREEDLETHRRVAQALAKASPLQPRDVVAASPGRRAARARTPRVR